MRFSPGNSSDIRRYYEGTFCKIPEYGDKLFLFKKILSKKEGVEIVLEDSKDETYLILLEEEEPYYLDFALPHKSLFNYRNSVVMLERIPARQYKRGISPDNTRLIDVFSQKVLPLTFQRLEAFVEKANHSSVNSALFDKRRVSLVGLTLSPRLSYNALQQHFYVDRHPFAKFLRDSNQIVPADSRKKYDLFLPELQKCVDPSYPLQPKFA